jgi:hypothetical protein
LSEVAQHYRIPAVDLGSNKGIEVHAQPIYGIDPNHSPIDSYMACRTSPAGTIRSLTGTTALLAAGGVIGTVPALKRWKLQSLVTDTTMTATVGNRLVRTFISDPAAAVVWVGAASTAVTAAQIGGYDVGFGPPLSTPSTTVRSTLAGGANTNVQVRENTSITELAAGSTITLDDSANIDIADSIAYRLMVIEYDA